MATRGAKRGWRGVGVVVLLALGAAVNVIVAWGCVLWTPNLPVISGTVHFNPIGYMPLEPGWGKPLEHTVARSLGYGEIGRWWWGLLEEGSSVPSGAAGAWGGVSRLDSYHAAAGRSGFPFASMTATRVIERTRVMEPPVRPPDLLGMPEGLPIPSPLGAATNRGRRLPVEPLWGGFLANTVVYAGVLWMLVCGRGAARRRVRRWKGLCVGCGYEVRELGVCPECGAQCGSGA